MKYRTIVADPPWPMHETGKTAGRVVDGAWWDRNRGGTVSLPYGTMTLADISELPVSDLAEDDSHLYLWTTSRFVEDAYDVVRAWGFNPGQLLTWCKPPMGIGFGGAFTTTTEFILSARRGSLKNLRRLDSSWWEWSRPYENGHIAHSAKPEAFLDTVEQVSPGPYLELFARRQRLGWDTWGDECRCDVEMVT